MTIARLPITDRQVDATIDAYEWLAGVAASHALLEYTEPGYFRSLCGRTVRDTHWEGEYRCGLCLNVIYRKLNVMGRYSYP